jgi:hypothetical protein
MSVDPINPLAHGLFQQPWPEGEYRFFQLGFIVDDLLPAAENWVRTFGIGPFHVLPRMQTPCTYRGTESVLDVRVCVAQAGPVQIELIQQFDDAPSVYRELTAAGTTLMHQMATMTEDYAATVAHYSSLGYELVCEVVSYGQHVAYFDTVADFGLYVEVIEQVPLFAKQIAAIAETSAKWDGTDPIRILTRDGYRTP